MSFLVAKSPLQCKRSQRFLHTMRYSGYNALRVVSPTSPVGAQPRVNSLSAVAAGETTQRVTGAVSCVKKRRRPLQSEHQRVSKKAPAQATPLLLKPSRSGPVSSRRIWARAGTTSFDGACCQGHQHSTQNPKPTPQPFSEPPHRLM